MRAAILTREFPPDVYGGAGVHVDFLVRELRRLDRRRRALHGRAARGRDRALREGRPARRRERRAAGALHRPGDDRGRRPTASTSCTRTPGTPTWPGTGPSCCTTSRTSSPRTRLEPQRPWKAEQLGGGYRLSLVGRAHGVRGGRRRGRGQPRHARPTSSRRTRRSTRAGCTSIYNGIDTDFYRPDPDTDVLERLGVDLDPAVRRVRRPDHPAEGRAAPAARRARASTATCSSCCSPARPTPPSSRPRPTTLIADAAGRARRRVRGLGDAAARGGPPGADRTRWRSCARRSTSRSAS